MLYIYFYIFLIIFSLLSAKAFVNYLLISLVSHNFYLKELIKQTSFNLRNAMVCLIFLLFALIIYTQIAQDNKKSKT